MPPRNVTIYKVYQLSTHRTLGFFNGEEDAVLMFCALKFNVEEDDIALERIQVRKITKEEVLCFREVIGQLRTYSDRIKALEEEASEAGMEDDIVDLLLEMDPVRRTP